MHNPKRVALFALCLGGIVFVGLLFAPFVMTNIISPLAMVAWLFLRIFVLSIPQEYYWWFIIIAGLAWIARRFAGGQPEFEERPEPELNAALKSVDNWRYILQVAEGYHGLRRELKRELCHMLISLFSARQQSATYSEVYEPLLQRQIPLPEPVYAFLFTPDPEDVQLSFIQKLRALPQAPRRWWRRWTGQERADYHQSIDAVLTFMETMLEVPHDDNSVDRRND